MKNDKAKKIIEDLMTDDKLYQRMSKKEGQVWGKVFADPVRAAAVKNDQKSAAELELNRHSISLPQQLRKHNIKPTSGLSLACGGGRAERAFLDQKVCTEFHGIDIAKDALQEAIKTAADENYNATYEQADLNQVKLDSGKYDLVVAQNCLHHVIQLEHLSSEIHASLKESGVLWISDYIGETQFQHTEERLEIVNRILDLLPGKYMEDKVNRRTLGLLTRRDPGTLISPFEAIRSAETMPIFLEKFDVIEKHEANAFLDLICPVGTRHNYLENEDSRALFELLLMFDELLIQHEILLPRKGTYLLRPKKLN